LSPDPIATTKPCALSDSPFEADSGIIIPPTLVSLVAGVILLINTLLNNGINLLD
jgi:hypothetical protein